MQIFQIKRTRNDIYAFISEGLLWFIGLKTNILIISKNVQYRK